MARRLKRNHRAYVKPPRSKNKDVSRMLIYIYKLKVNKNKLNHYVLNNIPCT